jgi:hypothetical protein
VHFISKEIEIFFCFFYPQKIFLKKSPIKKTEKRAKVEVENISRPEF